MNFVYSALEAVSVITIQLKLLMGFVIDCEATIVIQRHHSFMISQFNHNVQCTS